MTHAVRLADLEAMTEDARSGILARMVTEATGSPKGPGIMATARVRKFEGHYEMSSAQLLDRLSRNEVRETAEIVEWLFWLRLISRDG